MTKEELKDYLISEAEYTQEEVDNMSDRDLFDKYLIYEGIINFTDNIIDTCQHLDFDK